MYGLGANALDEKAAKKIYEAKGRPSDNPLIAHIADLDGLKPLVSEIPEAGRKLAEAFWPGPLTLVFPKSRIVPTAPQEAWRRLRCVCPAIRWQES